MGDSRTLVVSLVTLFSFLQKSFSSILSLISIKDFNVQVFFNDSDTLHVLTDCPQTFILRRSTIYSLVHESL